MKVSFLNIINSICRAPLKVPVKLSCFFYLYVFSCYSFASPNLILAGGALKTCASLSAKNCKSDHVFVNAKTHALYEVNAESLSRYRKNSTEFGKFDEVLYSKLSNIYSSLGGAQYKKNALFDALNDAGFHNDDIRSLSDVSYFLLLDSLEVSQVDTKGERLKERVSLAHTKEKASVDVYNAFLQAAKDKHRKKRVERRVRVGVITASSRDPFEAVDFYTGVFSNPNIDVQWIPLTPALQHAKFVSDMGGKGCENLPYFRAQFTLFDKARLYPERAEKQTAWCLDETLALDTLSNLDGLFFNGGDQSKTLAALTTPTGEPSTFLTHLRALWKADAIVVGGTSAGTAVQAGGFANGRPIPMLTSGDSEGVLSNGVFAVPPVSQRCEDGSGCENHLLDNAVTLNPVGGLGLFRYGLLDTHFSERDREVRLIAATAQSQQQFGFGVDETTALLVEPETQANQLSFSVIGKGGVFIVDLSEGRIEETRYKEEAKRIIAGSASFVPSGSKGTIREGVLNIDLVKQDNAIPRHANKKGSADGVWREQVMRLCRNAEETSWEHLGTTHVLKRSAQSVVQRNNYCGYAYVPFLVFEP